VNSSRYFHSIIKINKLGLLEWVDMSHVVSQPIRRWAEWAAPNCNVATRPDLVQWNYYRYLSGKRRTNLKKKIVENQIIIENDIHRDNIVRISAHRDRGLRSLFSLSIVERKKAAQNFWICNLVLLFALKMYNGYFLLPCLYKTQITILTDPKNFLLKQLL